MHAPTLFWCCCPALVWPSPQAVERWPDQSLVGSCAATLLEALMLNMFSDLFEPGFGAAPNLAQKLKVPFPGFSCLFLQFAGFEGDFKTRAKPRYALNSGWNAFRMSLAPLHLNLERRYRIPAVCNFRTVISSDPCERVAKGFCLVLKRKKYAAMTEVNGHAHWQLREMFAIAEP